MLLLSLVASAALGAEAPLPKAPDRWVTDDAALLSGPVRERLDQTLATVQRQTGHQVLVWIGQTTAGAPVEDFAVKAFAAWRVGRAGLDDGLVVFVFTRDRTARIEVGYGLEPVVPDAVASRLLRELLLPGLAAGRADEAVSKTVEALVVRLQGAKAQGDAVGTTAQRPAMPRTAQLILGALVALGFLVLFLINPRLALNLLFVIGGAARGRRHGGGAFGFSGGGGRSGGGGASGSW